MLKSWLMSPCQSEIEATTRQPKTAYTARTTAADSSGRPRQRPVKAIATHHRPTRNATQRANCPSSVIGRISGFGNGLVAGAAFGEHVGGPDDAIPAEPTLDHDLVIVGVGEGIRHQTVVSDRVGLYPVRNLEIDRSAGV